VRRSLAAIACLYAGLAVVAPAAAAPASSKLLWATIDECRSTPAGETVGVRGSMPGTGEQSEQMFMRFSLQYRGPAGHWRSIGGSSALVGVGSAAYVSRQGGLNFNLASSTAPGTVLRGVVSFEWRSGASVVQRAERVTSAGRQPSAGAHPAGYSAARCTVS